MDIIEAQTLNVGDRVIVFDHTLYKDDITTPLAMTMKPATITDIQIPYDMKGELLISVRFDHRPKTISRNHFSSYIERVKEEK